MEEGSDNRLVKGEIHISIYTNHPADATFEGTLDGNDMNKAWRGMLKSYRKWKHSLERPVGNALGAESTEEKEV